jgi:hypothetical protein
MVGLLFYVLFVALGVAIAYAVIRTAVRDGVVEANERTRVRLAKQQADEL